MAALADKAQAHEAERHSSVWGWVVFGILVAALCQQVSGNDAVVSSYVRRILILAGINVTLAVSLNLINGVTGQFSIGHAGFMAVGAYTASALTVFGGTALERYFAGGALDPQHPVLNLFLLSGDGLPHGPLVMLRAQVWFALVLLVSGLAAAAAGYLVGLPTLRLRGDYLAIATLGFGEIIKVLLLNTPAVGGASGFNGRPPFNVIPAYTNVANVYLAALVCIVVMTALKRSLYGRALLAVREDEIAAEAVGIDTTKSKVLAFAISAFFAGVAGGLLAHLQQSIIPRMFDFMRSVEVIVMVVLGGSGSTTGCVLAAVVLTILPEWLRDLGQWRMVLYAEILIVMMLVRRQGLLGSREITSQDWFRLAHFLSTRGAKGVWEVTRDWFINGCRRLRSRLMVVGQTPFTGWLAGLVLLLPWLDILASFLIKGAPGLPPATYAAEITAAVSGLVPMALQALPHWGAAAAELHLPLRADAALSVAMAPIILFWCGLAFGLAEGRRSNAWVLLGVTLVALWHSGGLIGTGHGSARVVLELAVAMALLVVTAVWLRVERRRAG